MTINDFADTLNLRIEIHRRCNFSDKNATWYASFDNVEIKDGPILKGEYGNGANPTQALRDYVERIKGKLIVHHAFSKELRREFNVPDSITFDGF